jgi:hypothetical protein
LFVRRKLEKGRVKTTTFLLAVQKILFCRQKSTKRGRFNLFFPAWQALFIVAK